MSRDDWEIVQCLTSKSERGRHTRARSRASGAPGTEVADLWSFITASYSGIKQTFKFLIAETHGKTVKELVAGRVPKGARARRGGPTSTTTYGHFSRMSRQLNGLSHRLLRVDQDPSHGRN